jgi:hypothetical protein
LLTRENYGKTIGWECVFLQNSLSSNNKVDSESDLETMPNKVNVFNQIIYTLAVTYKLDNTGDIPSTYVLIKGSGLKHTTLTPENNGTHDWLRVLAHSKAAYQ